MGAYDFLQQAQGVQLQDPMVQAKNALSLAQVANQGALFKYQLAQAQRQDAAAQGVGQALGNLPNMNDDAAVMQAIQNAPPEARQGLLTAIQTARKTKAEADYKTAQTGEANWKVKEQQVGLVGGLAQVLLSKPDVNQQDVMAAASNLKAAGLDPSVIIPPPGVDPKAHWQSLVGQATTAAQQITQQQTANQQAETGRHNLATEGQSASALAQTATRDANTAAYQSGELGNSTMRARAAMATADPFGVLGLNTGAPQAPSLPAGVNPGDAELFKVAAADAAKNGQPTFIVGGKTFNTTDAQAPAPTGGLTPIQKAVQSGLHGDEFLATLPPQLAAQVKGLSAGRQQFPSGSALRSTMIQSLIGLVAQYDPSFDQVNYGMRYKTAQDFAPQGKSGQNITALNTGIGHLQSLLDNMKALNNFGGLLTPLNAPINAFEQATGDPRQGRVELNAQGVAGELAKVFRSTGMSESDIQGWKARLGLNMSPDAQVGIIQEAMHMMRSRLEAIGDAYTRGMGKASDGITLLSPHAQAIYKSLSGGQDAPDHATEQGVQPAQSQMVDKLPDPASLPAGTRIRDTQTGQIMTSDGRTWR